MSVFKDIGGATDGQLFDNRQRQIFPRILPHCGYMRKEIGIVIRIKSCTFQTAFGTLSIIAGLMTFLYPETKTIGYIGSLDEAEAFYRNNITLIKYLGCGGKSADEEK